MPANSSIGKEMLRLADALRSSADPSSPSGAMKDIDDDVRVCDGA